MKAITENFVYRARRYSVNGQWFCWYEACPVIEHSAKFMRVVSQDFPNSPLYPGGEFCLRRTQLIEQGKCYHSRHGEWFYLEKPEQGDLFPSKDVVSTKSALEMEAEQMGWNIQDLTNEQFDAYIFAVKNGCSLAVAAR